MIIVTNNNTAMRVLDYGDVEPLALLNEVADEMAPVASSRRISFSLDVPPSLPVIQADWTRLKQVVLNIVTNAFKWGKEGDKVTVMVRKSGRDLRVEVQDTGPGIARKNHRKIFEAYYRVEGDTSLHSGLGLGLALCKTIVESHGGKIWVESEARKGSTFIFTIPLRDLGAKEIPR